MSNGNNKVRWLRIKIDKLTHDERSLYNSMEVARTHRKDEEPFKTDLRLKLQERFRQEGKMSETEFVSLQYNQFKHLTIRQPHLDHEPKVAAVNWFDM